jgi:hypothetical protein
MTALLDVLLVTACIAVGCLVTASSKLAVTDCATAGAAQLYIGVVPVGMAAG